MKENFKTLVDDKHSFNIDEDALHKLNITKISENYFHVIHKNKSYQVEITSSIFQNRTYKVKIEDNEYKVNIFNKLDNTIKDIGLTLKCETEINNIKAPMPGLILKLNVSNGDTVEENEPLLILEAMKMENIILSPKTGTIKSLPIKQGQTVDKNDLLVEFE